MAFCSLPGLKVSGHASMTSFHEEAVEPNHTETIGNIKRRNHYKPRKTILRDRRPTSARNSIGVEPIVCVTPKC